MGGLAGHMAHPYEDTDLTFGDIKAMFHQASKGKLEEVSEKLDGQNVFFTYGKDGLRFARNTTDIKNGGMDGDAILARWSEKVPQVAKAFNDAFKILVSAIAALSPEERVEIFQSDGKPIWYSAEILFSISRNVLNYDGDSIVFHKSGTVYDENGRPLETDTSANFAKLISNITKMQEAVKDKTINILGPIMVDLQKLANSEPLETALAELDSIMNQHNMSNDNTLEDIFVNYLIEEILSFLQTDYDTKLFVAELLAKFDEKITDRKVYLNELVKRGLITKDDVKKIIPLFSQAPAMYTNFIEPVREVIRNFAVKLMSAVQSYLSLNPNKEVQRLKGKIEQAKQSIEASGTEKQREVLQKEFNRLKDIDNITSSMEGIVFKYNNHMYKFTGAFSPINAILGIYKYGR